MHESSFGKEVFILGATLSGEITIEGWKAFLPEICTAAGLRPSHIGRTFDYPVEDGIYIGFIHIQPIITSFIVLDAWPNHDGAYLHICSCKPFNAKSVLNLIGTKYKIVSSFERGLTLELQG